jgi:hypothetical protein
MSFSVLILLKKYAVWTWNGPPLVCRYAPPLPTKELNGGHTKKTQASSSTINISLPKEILFTKRGKARLSEAPRGQKKICLLSRYES